MVEEIELFKLENFELMPDEAKDRTRAVRRKQFWKYKKKREAIPLLGKNDKKGRRLARKEKVPTYEKERTNKLVRHGADVGNYGSYRRVCLEDYGWDD